jgi:hypothetical protein
MRRFFVRRIVLRSKRRRREACSLSSVKSYFAI